MIEYIKDLPSHIKLSDYLKSKAQGYISVMSLGKRYYIPLTKEIKKVFGISRKKDEIVFKNIWDDNKFDTIVRTIINAVYLQTRDTVGMEIREEVVRMVEDKLNNVIVPQIDSEIESRFNDKETKLLDKGQ